MLIYAGGPGVEEAIESCWRVLKFKRVYGPLSPLLPLPMCAAWNYNSAYNCLHNFYCIRIISDLSHESMYKQDHGAVSSTTVPLASSSEKRTSTDKQHHNKWLYCGYCDVQYKTPTDLVKHCKQDLHKYAVFADSGRDVFWEFEPPPAKKHAVEYG